MHFASFWEYDIEGASAAGFCNIQSSRHTRRMTISVLNFLGGVNSGLFGTQGRPCILGFEGHRVCTVRQLPAQLILRSRN